MEPKRVLIQTRAGLYLNQDRSEYLEMCVVPGDAAAALTTLLEAFQGGFVPDLHLSVFFSSLSPTLLCFLHLC